MTLKPRRFTLIVALVSILLLFSNSKKISSKESLKEKNAPFCQTYDAKREAIVTKYLNDNKNSLTEEDIKLVKFIAGSCLPVVMLPGLYGTKLQVHITNCKEFNENHAEIAKSCGWDKACKDGFEETFWLNEKYFNSKNSECGGRLLQLHYKKIEGTSDYVEVPTKGFIVTGFGNTPKTKSERKCGFGSVTNIWEKWTYFGGRFPRGDLDLMNSFINLGYELGINFFAIPQEWRKMGNDIFNLKLIIDTLEHSYKLNRKPAILIGHSYGTATGLSYLYSANQEDKDRLVSRFITVGGPFSGVSKGVKAITMSMNDFNMRFDSLRYPLVDMSMSTNAQKIYVHTYGLADLLPKMKFFKINQNEEWMQLALKRAKVENIITNCVRTLYNSHEFNKDFIKGVIANDELLTKLCIQPTLTFYKEDLEQFDSKFKIFPKLEQGCDKREIYSVTFHKEQILNVWDTYCRLNVRDPFENYIFEVKDGNKENKYNFFENEQFFNLLTNYGVGSPDIDYYKFLYRNFEPKYDTLPPTGVNMSIIYSTSYITENAYHLQENPKIYTDQGKYGSDLYKSTEDYTVMEGGDASVPSYSSVIPLLKFITDYREGKSTKGLDIISFCSNPKYNQNHTYVSGGLNFLTIGCDCKGPLEEGCSHAGMIMDSVLIKKINDYATDKANLLSGKDLDIAIDLVKREVNNSGRLNCKVLDDLYQRTFPSHK